MEGDSKGREERDGLEYRVAEFFRLLDRWDREQNSTIPGKDELERGGIQGALDKM